MSIPFRKHHWFVDANEISINFIACSVIIDFNFIESGLYYQMTVKDEDYNDLRLIFLSLDEAVDFAETFIENSHKVDEVQKFYEEEILLAEVNKTRRRIRK